LWKRVFRKCKFRNLNGQRQWYYTRHVFGHHATDCLERKEISERDVQSLTTIWTSSDVTRIISLLLS
jgi:hypothetical protein